MSAIATQQGERTRTANPPTPRLNLIAGRWVEGQAGAGRTICNPADTAEEVANVREAAPAQIDEACAAAAKAFPAWRATPAADRARVLFKYRELLESHFLDLAKGI